MRDAHAYVGASVLILFVASGLLCVGKLDAVNYVDLIKWTFASVCGGGGLAAVRGIQINGGKNGK